VSLKAVFQRRPEWWSVLLSAGAWVLLARDALRPSSSLSMAPGMKMPAGMKMTANGGAITMSAGRSYWMFLLMVVAMMVPLTIPSLRTVAARSVWRRRHVAVAEFLLGFLGVWLVEGAVLVLALRVAVLGGVLHLGTTAVALCLLAAAGWQFTSFKRRALNRHHRSRPLAPHGRRADWHCLRYGSEIAVPCLVSCSLMMTAMLMDMGLFLPMLAMTVLLGVERFRYRPPRRTVALGLAALAVALVALL
jgi:hypothetical protein